MYICMYVYFPQDVHVGRKGRFRTILGVYCANLACGTLLFGPRKVCQSESFLVLLFCSTATYIVLHLEPRSRAIPSHITNSVYAYLCERNGLTAALALAISLKTDQRGSKSCYCRGTKLALGLTYKVCLHNPRIIVQSWDLRFAQRLCKSAACASYTLLNVCLTHTHTHTHTHTLYRTLV